MIDLDELERLARNADSAKWRASDCSVETEDGRDLLGFDDWNGAYFMQDAVRDFVAAANPAAILELIRMVREK